MENLVVNNSKTLIISEDNLDHCLEQLLANFDYQSVKIGKIKPFCVRIIGEQFNGTLTASIMKGLIELQDGINRSYCLAKYHTNDLRQLTDSEKKQLEFVFKIERGSTGLFGDLQELLTSLNQLLENMTPKQKTIILCTVIMAITGYFLADLYRDYAVRIDDNKTKVVLEQERTKQLTAIQDKTLEAVKIGIDSQKQQSTNNKEEQNTKPNEEQPIELNPKNTNTEIQSSSFKLLQKPDDDLLQAFDELQEQYPIALQTAQILNESNTKFIRSMKFADRIEYNNTFEATGNILENLTQAERQTWKETTLTDKFRILDIDSSKLDYRSITLRDSNGREFVARFTDESISKDKYHKLTKAMYGYNPIELSITAKTLKGKLKDGMIKQVRDIDTSHSFKAEEVIV